MAQATYSIRMDEELKKNFDNLCDEFGMTATVAFNVFAKEVVRERKIPFIINADSEKKLTKEEMIADLKALQEEAKANGTSGMSLEDINKVIYG